MSIRNKTLDFVKLVKARQGGLRRRDLEMRWSCSAATVRRVVQEAKDEFGLPVYYDASRGVYRCDPDKAVELPGLWFDDAELAALSGLTHWLDAQGSGVLRDLLDPLRDRMESMLRDRGIGMDAWRERIRFLPMAARPVPSGLLLPISKAVLDRTRLSFHYKGAHDGRYTEREVSPQSLVRYRDNWLLDAFCHTHNGLRSFVLSRMKEARALSQAALEIPRVELDRHFAESYGIFGGRARYRASLVFEGLASRLVEGERWHPKQKSQTLSDGRTRLEFPCGDLRELVRDLMRYADEVTVEGPERLRTDLAAMIDRAAARGSGKAASPRSATVGQAASRPTAGPELPSDSLPMRAGSAQNDANERST